MYQKPLIEVISINPEGLLATSRMFGDIYNESFYVDSETIGFDN